MTYRQIETSREIRLWIRDIIVPAATCAVTVYALHPGVKQKVNEKIEIIKSKFTKNK